MRTGVWLYPAAPARSLIDAIVALDRAGVDEVWVADEGVARDPFALLAAAATHTTHIRLCVGITTPLLRHPGAVASTAMTIDEISGGRFVLGWGVGGHESLGPFGLRTERPVGVVADALRIAGAVMDGVPCEGYTPPSHAAPPRRVPQYIGARGPQLNRLASRGADGVFLSGFSEADLPGAIEVSRSVRPIDTAVYVSVRFTTPADQWSIAGSVQQLADHLERITQRHQPTVIGAALVDFTDPVDMAHNAIALLTEVRQRCATTGA